MAELGSYSFLPWLRRGIANQITAADGDTTVATRPSTPVVLRVSGDALGGGTVTADVEREVELYGPGDVIGIDSRVIVRTEPRNWVTNFEPNYLAFLEFYEEDFPWRYTPAAPGSGARLRPWLALAVLEEDEFTEAGQAPGAPLPTIAVPDLAVFAPADELWAWAHVHSNRRLAASDTEVVSTDIGAVLPKLESVLGEDPDLASSRLLCPRQLTPDTAYHAFLVPTFETGRLAGLGLAPEDAPHATHSAWADYAEGTRPSPDRFPYYFRWFFRTGVIGDFEYLVRLLQPRPVDARVGVRDIDVQDPGSNVPAIIEPELGGVLRLGGALKVPESVLTEEELEEAERYEAWNETSDGSPHPFQSGLAALVNLADDYDGAAAGDANAASGLGPGVEDDPDPLVTPPLYGRWHSLHSRLLTDRDGNPLDPDDNWLHELNLDPRFRVPAAFGTGVVQQGQEEYMAAAWQQVGDVLAANRRIRAGQLALQAAAVIHIQHVEPLLQTNRERAVLITAPVHSRVLAGDVTLRTELSRSVVAAAPTSAAMRRAVRPGSRLVRSLEWAGEVAPGTLLTRMAAGVVAAAPPKTAPEAVSTADELAEELAPKDGPNWLLDALERWPWLRWVPLVLGVLLCFFIILGVWLWRVLSRWHAGLVRAASVHPDKFTPDAVDDLPRSPDFVLTEPGTSIRPTPGRRDSSEAARFKTGLRDLAVTLQASTAAAQTPPRTPVDIRTVAATAVDSIEPSRTVPRRVLGSITLPGRLAPLPVEQFKEAMAHPVIDLPMYKPLVDMGAEHFLPNVNLIPQDSITVLETNQRFIESYLVGLNHEMARELLWREYPTDQRGSVFRQFWDVSAFLGAAGTDPAELQESLRDVPPLHRWPRRSALGDHDNREVPGETEEELVLVIRGELLKRYPTAVIYAHSAEWQLDDDGEIDNAKERRLVPLTPAEEDDPPRTKVKTPLYEAKVDPDIYFFGFDLTEEDAKGGTGEPGDEEPGWFFVIKERPGEPRFGFDSSRDGQLNVWNDLAWPDVADPEQRHLVLATSPSHSLVEPTDPAVTEKVPQWEDDRALTWSPATMNASDVAYIAYQAPVLVAVHAAEMLKPGATT